MSDKNNGSQDKAIAAVFVTLIASSLYLAMIDPDNRPVYFQVIDLVVTYSMKLPQTPQKKPPNKPPKSIKPKSKT
ncbi:hypothetical protein [Calothrix sp. 336/3]|uniref:hypothetical protein n=1 Tax=Calothrix sp. 336/3 TaxID=1337936 RepID=UPI0004E3D570|nr:hypothetical protein [Calothrix sp. 336/3]AKG20867.1 hypothetical protein IJ00_05720 [Calothrix sp. 336/3]